MSRADELAALQRKERGTERGPLVDNKLTVVPGPYVATPERESRADEIIRLRRREARARYPL